MLEARNNTITRLLEDTIEIVENRHTSIARKGKIKRVRLDREGYWKILE